MASDKENRFINEALEEWGNYVLSALSDKIKSSGLILSGETLKSLQFQVLAASKSQVGKLLLAFNESGRIRDMKNLNVRKLSPIEEMIAYVKKVGLQNFDFVPGYQKSGRMPAESIAINRVAWGIARGRQKSQKIRPKKWFARTFYGTINTLITKLLKGYQDQTVEQIKQGFNGSQKG